MFRTLKSKKKLAIFTFTTTLIAGVISMAFSKKVKSPETHTESIKSFYDIKVNDINGEKINLKSFRGKKIMVVNVASRCGYTSQYEDLQSLYKRYKDNLEIIAMPCNDYGSQESGSNAEIKQFCQLNYGVTFTMGEKQKIKSSPISSLYEWLSNPELNGWNSNLPSWNFCKYIIDEKGNLTHFLKSGVNPSGTEIERIISS
ncbi:MAG: glutathione peroxidase [Candidatus Neomarinimicrobiota bacterium]